MKKLLIGLISLFIISTTSVYAVLEDGTEGGGGGSGPTPVSIKGNFSPAGRFDNIAQIFSDLFYIMEIVGGVMAIIFVIIGGIKMVTGAGDPKALESARSTVIYALVGLSVIALAFVLVQVLQYILRSNIPINK
ncbi:hypothetical protein HY024_00635 [Candidatus Curtissbacteria bacterium]|nr:hypothetical protein [Candidatus Curtissbacteria bacterium]